jgi:hypothetical protein
MCSRGELRLQERGGIDPTTGDETAVLLLQTFASFKTPVPPDMSALVRNPSAALPWSVRVSGHWAC